MARDWHFFFLRIVCFELDAKEEDGRGSSETELRNSALLIVSVLCAEPPKRPMFLRRCWRRQSRMGARSPFLSQQLHYADALYINRSTYLDPPPLANVPTLSTVMRWLVLNLKNDSQRTKYRRWLASPLVSYYSIIFPFVHPLYIEHKFLVVKTNTVCAFS